MALPQPLLRIKNAVLRRAARHSAPARLMRGLPESWFGPDCISNADHVFIGGCARSGTSILRETLGRHSRLGIGPETPLFSQRPNLQKIAAMWEIDVQQLTDRVRGSASLTEFVDGFFAMRLAQTGKARYVEKSIGNVEAIPKILALYPNARFIHMLRDGRDVACSLRHFPLYGWNGFGISGQAVNRSIAASAALWKWYAGCGLAHRDHPRCLEVRYEELMADPQAQLGRICAFLGEPFEMEMLASDPVDPSAWQRARFLGNPDAGSGIRPAQTGRWRSEMSPAEQRDFRHIAGSLLVAAGYESGDDWIMG